MSFANRTLAVPLRVEESGAVRVGGTRVLFWLVIHAFQDGATPDRIVQMYSSVTLAEVYAVVAFYLANKPEVEAFLAQVEAEAAAIRRELEARPGAQEMRERILKRRAEMQRQSA